MGISNSWFDFKQFRISQGNCAMKVTTDACIQGAWTPINPDVKHVLDIGTGTGLLALMTAQKNAELVIDAIEIDKQAAAQARVNVAGSPWAARIEIFECDIRTYKAAYKYDLIISNPPFFNNSMLSSEDTKNVARHTVSLNYEELFNAIKDNISENGTASVLLPYPESGLWEDLVLKNGWHVAHTLSVKHKDSAPVKRKVIVVTKNRPEIRKSQTLVIQKSDGSYTDVFTRLLSPYYLNL